MDFKKYLGKHVLDNVEDVIVPDVDLVDDLGNMLNVYFPLEQFEDAPEKLLRTGLLVFYDVDRSVTDILFRRYHSHVAELAAGIGMAQWYGGSL